MLVEHIDKNWYQYPANESIPLRIEWDDEDFTEAEYEATQPLFSEFPRNVATVLAQRRDDDGLAGILRVGDGLYMYYYVSEEQRTLVLAKKLRFYSYGFDINDVNWDLAELQPDPDPVFNHPIFDLSDEV